jgi:hypothetical protein
VVVVVVVVATLSMSKKWAPGILGPDSNSCLAFREDNKCQDPSMKMGGEEDWWRWMHSETERRLDFMDIDEEEEEK